MNGDIAMHHRDSARMSSRVIGVRGKLVFALLIIVTLSMWILGLSLMQLMRTAIAEQLNAKAVVIASAIESAIEIGQTRQLGLIGGKGRGFPLGRLLQSFISDPDVSALAVMDSDGKIIASAALNPAGVEEEETPGLEVQVIPVSLGEDDTGLLKITFSKRSQQQKTALSLIRVIIQLGITALILFVLMSILVNITVLTPVRSLLAITNRIGGGDFSSAVGEVGNDEFGDLGRSFEAMQSRLRESEEKNRQQYESLRRAHHELQDQENRIVQSEKMAAVGRVAAGVAHEVGNPLGSVTGYLSMLRDEKLTEAERKDYLLRMEAEIGRVNRIMLDLLNYARPPSPEFSEIDLSALLKEIRDVLSSQDDFEGIDIQIAKPERVTSVKGDLHRVRQMFVNLILNAAQAMTEGGRISIDIASAGEAGSPEVSISDEGMGIPPDDLPHIFDPFFTTGKGGRGSGLGLALCQQIASSMGAVIEVDSSPGEGATFRVMFSDDSKGHG